MVGIENNQNVLNTLKIVKEKYKLDPDLIICDFSPNIIGPVCELFGIDKLQIDGFHVMQELNRGIRHDLLTYKNKMFVNEIQEFKLMRKWLSCIQKDYVDTGLFSYDLKILAQSINNEHNYSSICLNIINLLIPILKVDLSFLFETELKEINKILLKQPDDNISWLVSELVKDFPKREFTNKGIIRYKNYVLKKLKTLLVKYRLILERENKEFYRNYWILFCQPETMTEERIKVLESFLSKYAELEEYRNMTLSIGEIYRKDILEIDGTQIDNLVVKNYYSDKLKAAIKTIKKYKNSIIRFAITFKNQSKIGKLCHSSMEHLHNKVKLPFKFGFNRCSLDTVKNKLQLQLGCEVQINL